MGILTEIREYVWPSGAVEMKSGVASLPAVGTPEYYNYLLGITAGRARSGVDVSLRTALGVSTVFACVNVLAQGVAQVPCKVYRMNGNVRKEARDHPLWYLLYRKPNALQTSFEFREQIVAHAALTGNAFIIKIPDARGRVSELLPVEPGLVRMEYYSDRTIRYWVRPTEKSAEVEIPASMMWHLRGPSWTGFQGMDVLRLAREAVGLAMAAESFGGELFANGVRLSGHLEIPGNPSPESLENIRTNWAMSHQGSENRLKTGLLTGGMKFVPHTIAADEAQYIETRKFLIPEICRFFRVSPVMVGHDEGSAAYASVEQRMLAHRFDTLGPLFERFEQSAECALLTAAEREEYEIELVDRGLCRVTAKERAEVLAILRQNGAITGNDMREEMDYPRVNDAVLDEFTPAANLFGQRAPVEE
jgi:HK97 family phage portal protein